MPPEARPPIEVGADPGLPPVWADHDRLEQVFVNLLDNAFGHNPPGTRVTVRAAAAEPAGWRSPWPTTASASPAEVAAAPFEPMRRRRAPTAGAGLGLSIARGIVDGPRRAPRPGERGPGHPVPGLAAGRERLAAAGSAAAEAQTRVPERADVRTRALVVEDDPNIVDLIRSNLSVRGFDTVVSADGVRALQLLETEEPDIVLLDLMLPEVDGFELCRQIRERLAVGDHRGVRPRRRAGQGHRAQHGRRRLHDQAVQHRGAAGPDHRHAAPDPARGRARAGPAGRSSSATSASTWPASR